MTSLKIKKTSRSCWLLMLVILVLLLSGCATMGRDECLHAQWQNIGYEDGAKGYTAQRISEHRKACAEYNISPDLDAYRFGRLQGLQEWCTPSNGYYQGTRGVHYNGVCPGDLEGAFQAAMSQGRVVYNLNNRIKNHEREIAHLHDDINRKKQEISEKEAELISNEALPERRRLLLDEIIAAERNLEELRYDISDAEVRLERLRRKLARMTTRHRY